jgi:hypothetical protein
VTSTDEYIFLEVNEMGQFLWKELVLPELKLLDKFCEFLISNNSNENSLTKQDSISLEEITNSVSYQNLTQKDTEENNRISIL